MKNKRKSLIPIVIFCILSVTYADKCFSGCHGSAGTYYKYEEGTNYKYKLEGSTITTVSGSSGDVSKVSLAADVDISAQAQCGYILQLSNVQVTGPDGKSNNLKDLEQHPVKFSFHDGHVESEVCSEEGDSENSLNIKRAVISLLQSAIRKDTGVTSHYETDVFGTCPTNFEFSKSGTTLKIKKFRNLNQCAHRENLNLPIFSTPYSINSEYQSSPLLISSLKVEQQVQDGIVNSAVGEEKYLYQPHSTVESGVTVVVKTKLSFVSQAKGASISAKVVKPKSIIFDVPHDSSEFSSVDAIQNALNKAEASVEPTIQPSAASDFADLVDILSKSKKADILTVFAGVKSKETARKILLDGVTRASTGDAVEVLSELVQANELTKLQKNIWIISLGFIKHVTRASLKAVLPILNNGPRQAYLGVGSLTGRYCSKHDCTNDDVFKEVLNKLAEPIASGCKADSYEKENKIIASLKGLHNVHHLTNEVAEKLSQCANDKKAKTRVRVAALETFQSDASKDKLKSTAISILKNLDEDAEVRIKAYLALVECPCNKVADTIKTVLDNEKVNQVGSFITSHLRNLKASTNPDKAAAKHFLDQIHISKKFPIDIRKYSHNHELSYSIDAVNLGASGESNVIFSEKSYIPRSYSLNLTTQFFGHAFNLIEFNARAENVDYIFEKYFGPKGYFPTHDAKNLFETVHRSAESLKKKIADKYQETIRPKRETRHPRDIHQQTNQFAKKVDLGVDSHDNDLDLDLSLKLYGSEVGWYTLHGNKQLKPDDIINKLFQSVDDSFDKAKNLNFDYKKHTTFLDAEAIYPTGLGLPLKLNTKGSAAVRVKFDGKVDVPAIIKDPRNAYVKFQVVPSAAIELSGQVSIDAVLVESGVKVFGNVHTATGSDLSVRFLEGHGIDVKVGLPIKKQDIFSFHSNIVTVVKEKGQPKSLTPVKFDTKRQEYSGCFDQLNPLIGLTFCGEFNYPFDNQKLLSPAYGPTNVAVSVEKDDESLTTYHFKAYYNTKETNQRSLEILLDTPNSKTNRKLSLLITGGKSPLHLTATLTSPWKIISFDGRVNDNDKEHSLSVKLLDDSTEYSAKAGVLISGDGDHQTFKPVLEYKIPEFKAKETGLIGVKGGKGKSHKAVAVSGTIKLDKVDTNRKYTLEGVTITTPSKEYKIDGFISHDKAHSLETDLRVTYDKESVAVKSNIQTAGKGKLKVYLDTAFSEVPDFNFVLNWEFNRDAAAPSIGNVITLVHGPDPKSEAHKISINQFLLYRYSDVRSFDFDTKNSLSYPLVALSGTFNAHAAPKSISLELDGTYDRYRVGSSLKGGYSAEKPGDYNVNFKAQVLDNSIDFHAKREIVADTKSKFTNSLEIKPGGKYQLNALVTHNFQKDNYHNHIHAEAKFPTDPKHVKLDAGVKSNKKEFSTQFDVTAGDKKLVEFIVELQKDKPSGNFKASLPPNFDSNGNFKLEGGKGIGSFVFNFPKQERRIEGKSEFTHSGTKYEGFADVSWDAIKNPQKTLRVETKSDFSKNNIDTKNTITYKGEHKTQINYKGKLLSSTTEEAYSSEAQLVLPSGRSFAAAYNGKCVHQTEDYDGDIDFQFTDYSAPGVFSHKIGFKLNAKNVNPSKNTLDGQAHLTYSNAAGKDAKFQAALKKILTGDRWTISAQASASGSLTQYPVSFKLDSEVSEQFLKCRLSPDNTLPFGTYQLVANAGDISLSSNGKINQNVINNEVDVKLPADYSVTSFKWTSTNHYAHLEKITTNNVFNWNGDKFVKVVTEGGKEENGVTGKLEWESHLKSVRTLTGQAHYKPTADGDKKIDASLNFAYEGKSADLNLKAEYDKKSENIQVQLNGNLPQQGKFDVSVKNKVVAHGKGFQTDVVLLVNDKKITVTNQVVLDKENPLIDLVAEHPQGKSRVFFKIEKKGNNHYVGESKVKWVGNGGGNLAVDGEAKYDSVDDFFIKINADSPKLNIEKYHVEIINKPGKQAGKRISFAAKSADKNIFSGSTSYNFKAEGTSKIVDGSGNIKIGDKSHNLNFKFVAQELIEAENGEDGNQINLNVKFGKNTFDLLGKLTATTFLVRRTYTKETGEVTKAEISSKIKKYSVAEYDYEFLVLFDLSKLFKDTEDLSLKITTKRNGFILDHNFELQRNPESKIKYQLYIHENQAGAVLTLPKRVVAVEAKYEVPKKKSGIIQAEAALWLDKQKAPAEKTSIAFNADINKIGQGGSFQGEIRATHPALGKDLAIKGHATVLEQWNKLIDAKVDFDIFAKKEQKISVEYKSSRNKEKDGYSVVENLRVKGANIDIEYKQNLIAAKSHINYGLSLSYVDANNAKSERKVHLEVSPTKVSYIVKIPEGVLVSLNSKIKESPNHYSIETEHEVLGEKYGETIDFKNQNSLQYVFTFDKGGKEKKFVGDFSVVLGQSADFSTTFNNNQLGFVQVALDDGNFLKSKYKYNTDVFKTLIETGREDYVNLVKKLKETSQVALDRLSKDIVHQVEQVQKALPNFSPVVKAYTDQIEALRQEVVNEKSIQEAADYIKGTLSVILEQVVVVLEEAAKATESLVALFNEVAAKFSEAIKNLAPKITASYESIAKVFVQVFEESLKFSVEVINVILDKIKEHEDEVQVIVSATTEFLSEVGQLAVKTFVQVKAQVKDFVDLFIEQVKALPIFSMIKERIEELKAFEIPEQSWSDYHEFISTVKDVFPTPEISHFFITVSSYVEKVLRHQPVNWVEDLKTLYTEFVAAVKSLLSLAQQHVPQEKFVKPSIIPLPALTLWKIPKGALRFSPIAWLQSSDLPSVSDIYYTYRPTLNPLDYIPPYKARAYLIASSEFFSFDQRHITINGNCLYVLAQDFVDGNFSIAARIDSGKVNSIIVTDAKDSIELLSDGTVKLNNAVTEFPVQQDQLNAWRRYTTSNIYSRAGVAVHCSIDLEFCSFHVSGFYFGKTRGLLGTINNEQYNDLTLPNGKIAPSVTDFANAYKLGTCGDIAAAAPAQEQQNSHCTGFFTDDSTLRSCFSYVNPHCYRHACNLVTANAADKKAAACKVAIAYSAACENSGGRASVPSECIQCNINGKTVGEDDSVTVTTPQNKADIVLVVEQVEENEEVFNSLVTPLIGQLTKDLNAQGITDVHFSLIGFGAPNMKWPQHYTTNGKLDFNGKSTIYFSKKAAQEKSECEYYERYRDLRHYLNIETGNTAIHIAFQEASKYPFRADAVKAVIGVLGGPCERSKLPVSLQHVRMGLHLVFHKLTSVNYHLITRINDLHYADKDAKQGASDVVGFNKERVFLLGNNKKSSTTLTPSALKYNSDICVQFTEIVDGLIYNSANFLNGKADSRKQFLHTLSSSLAESLTEKQYTLECKCVEKEGSPKTDCEVESSEKK